MIKGILFDKDGTLIDFFSLWLKAALETVPVFLRHNEIEPTAEMQEYIQQVIGIEKEKVDPKGALAYKSYGEIAKDISAALEEKQIYLDAEAVRQQIETLFVENVTGNGADYQQFVNVEELIETLKECGIAIGLATADTVGSATACLEKLNVLQEFDYVGADDGIMQPKPAPDMFERFKEQTGLDANEIAVVGDTYNDIVFAKENGGIAIGVLSGVSSREDFHGEADYVLDSIGELPDIIEAEVKV